MNKKGVLEVKKLDVLSVGKVCALLGAFFGFVFGILIALMLNSFGNMPELQETMAMSPLSTGQLFILPFQYLLIMGILSGISGLLCSLVYNMIARTGGIKFSI